MTIGSEIGQIIYDNCTVTDHRFNNMSGMDKATQAILSLLKDRLEKEKKKNICEVPFETEKGIRIDGINESKLFMSGWNSAIDRVKELL